MTIIRLARCGDPLVRCAARIASQFRRYAIAAMRMPRLGVPRRRCGLVVLLTAAVLTSGAAAQAPIRKSESSKIAKSPAAQHKVAIQVNQNDKAVMELVLNNVRNITEHYKDRGESVAIEVVAYGPGLHMLRSDTSPVKDRIAPMSLENPSVSFIACGNTQANQSKAEGKPVTLLSEAKVVPSGVVRLIELQQQGWAYIKP
jgi:uncharacterized protein